MVNIKIIIDGALMDGHKVTFKAPCDCTSVEQLKVLYVKDGAQVSKLFTMKDSHGNTLTGLGNLFEEGAYVHAILDTVNGYAYIQNPDTNGYLEGRFQDITNSILDTMEEINANTQDNQLAGALAVKEFGQKYLPLTGGNIKGAVEIDGTLYVETVEGVWFTIQTGADGRKISMISVNNMFGFNDDTHKRWIMKSEGGADGRFDIFQKLYVNEKQVATTDDLANYLPLSGGKLSGELIHEAGSRWSYNDRNMLIEIIGSTFGFWDSTNSKWWLNSETDKTNIYQPLFINGSKALTAADFVVTGSADEATLTINLD